MSRRGGGGVRAFRRAASHLTGSGGSAASAGRESGLDFHQLVDDHAKLRSPPAASSMLRVTYRSEAVDADRGQFVGRGLADVAIVMNLHELGPGNP